MSFLYKVISHAVQSKCSWNFCPLYNREGVGKFAAGGGLFAYSQHMTDTVTGEHEGNSLRRFYFEGRVYAGDPVFAIELFGKSVRYVAEVR